MNNLEILSTYSNYTKPVDYAYSSQPVIVVKNKQEISIAKDNVKENPLTGEINDEVIISEEAKNLLAAEQADSKNINTKKDTKTEQEQSTLSNKKELTEAELIEISKLKASDAEVRAHEQAHIAAAVGINASAPSYEYQTGPDGKKYAVGGEVNINFTEGQDPVSNLHKAKILKAAALAPAKPSSQDYSVARVADGMIIEAKQEIAEQRLEESDSDNNSTKTDNTNNQSPSEKTNQVDNSDSITQVSNNTTNVVESIIGAEYSAPSIKS